MEDTQKDDEFGQWFSTYGVITAERLLGTYQINIPSSELLVAIKSPSSFYHHLLQVPLRNILNGIVLQQANDYHIYTQKLFIDYLLSGESGKGEEAQGALTRGSLENERTQLVTLGEEFNRLELEHNALIASSQARFIKIVKEWKAVLESTIAHITATLKNYNSENKKSKVRQGVHHALIYCDVLSSESPDVVYLFTDTMTKVLKLPEGPELKEQLAKHVEELLTLTQSFSTNINDFFERACELSEQAQSYRSQFYETIIRVLQLIKLLPDYKINPTQDVINREPLYFDAIDIPGF